MMFCTHCGKEVNKGVIFCPHCGSPTGHSEKNERLVSFWYRLLAFSADSALLGVTLYIITFIVIHVLSGTALLILVLYFILYGNIITIAIIGIYYVFFWVRYDGQTPGDMLMAIRVERIHGKPIRLSTAVIRYIGFILSSIPVGLGFLWVLWDDNRQGWHDKLAKTIVVRTNKKPNVTIAKIILTIWIIIILYSLYNNYIASQAINNALQAPVSSPTQLQTTPNNMP